MKECTYTLELTDLLLGKKCIGHFATYQRSDGWFAQGYVVAADGTEQRSYGCSKTFEIESDAIDYLLNAECASNIYWL